MLLSLRLQFVDFAFNLRSLVLVHNVNIMEDWNIMDIIMYTSWTLFFVVLIVF